MTLSPLDLLLMNYATGSLSQQESLIVAAHLTLNAEARRRVQRYEAEGGKMMCETEPAAVRAECLNETLSRIEKTPIKPMPAATPCAPDLHIPAAIYALISGFCVSDRRNWSRVTRGFTKMDLRLCPAPTRKRLRLMKLEPHATTPRHSHPGRETTVVLEGSFRDQTGQYKKGDIIIITDARFIHQPVAGERGCVCLTLTEAPLRFQDPFQRFMNAFWRV
ncbi:MAG: ChrR family anti-sigma-E factor [Alphaproteobacteria bacterium]